MGNEVRPSPVVMQEWGDARAVKARFGLGKTTLYHLVEAGRIRSVSLREPGAKRGKRLFSMESIAGYIETLAGDSTRVSDPWLAADPVGRDASPEDAGSALPLKGQAV